MGKNSNIYNILTAIPLLVLPAVRLSHQNLFCTKEREGGKLIQGRQRPSFAFQQNLETLSFHPQLLRPSLLCSSGLKTFWKREQKWSSFFFFKLNVCLTVQSLIAHHSSRAILIKKSYIVNTLGNKQLHYILNLPWCKSGLDPLEFFYKSLSRFLLLFLCQIFNIFQIPLTPDISSSPLPIKILADVHWARKSSIPWPFFQPPSYWNSQAPRKAKEIDRTFSSVTQWNIPCAPRQSQPNRSGVVAGSEHHHPGQLTSKCPTVPK